MEDGDIPPFWQPPATIARRHRRRPSSLLLNSSLLIILLPSISLLFIVFIVIPSIPKILHHYNKPINPPQNQKAISVRKSWDSLNIILVVFAILCGVFAKRNDDSPAANEREEMGSGEQQTTHNATTRNSSSSGGSNTVLLQRSKTMMHHQMSSSVPQWFEYSQQQRIISSSANAPPATGISRLRRTVSSDPYMRYQTGNSQFRFFDDLDISKFYPNEDHLCDDEIQYAEAAVATEAAVEQVDDVEITTEKDIEVDTFVLENRGELPSPAFSPPQTPPRNPPSAPPPPPPPPPSKQRRTFQTLPRREQVPPSPPPPPPPPPQPLRRLEEKKRSSRKRMNSTKEIATAIVHLYSHRKRKRRQKLSRNFEDPSHSGIQSQFIPPPSPPPPPPPLPPHPPSVFQNWFKKGSKSKKIHSFSSIPKPPLPPTRQYPVNSVRKPPLPTRRESGNESPMNGVPPPPPPPPFKVSQMKFKPVEGGYVRVQSAQSSRCGSPEIIDGVDDAISSSSEMNGQDGERLSSVTCPSPDLNVKVASFIARHHDGWRLEKLNSWREKLNKAGDGPTSRPSF